MVVWQLVWGKVVLIKELFPLLHVIVAEEVVGFVGKGPQVLRSDHLIHVMPQGDVLRPIRVGVSRTKLDCSMAPIYNGQQSRFKSTRERPYHDYVIDT